MVVWLGFFFCHFPLSVAMRAYKHQLPDYYLFSFSSWTSYLVSYEPFSFLFTVFTLSRSERTETTEPIRIDKDRDCRRNPDRLLVSVSAELGGFVSFFY